MSINRLVISDSKTYKEVCESFYTLKEDMLSIDGMVYTKNEVMRALICSYNLFKWTFKDFIPSQDYIKNLIKTLPLKYIIVQLPNNHTQTSQVLKGKFVSYSQALSAISIKDTSYNYYIDVII